MGGGLGTIVLVLIAMFFGIDRARFLIRQILGGERQRALVRVVSPAKYCQFVLVTKLTAVLKAVNQFMPG